MAETSTIEVPADLAKVAEDAGVPLDLVRRGLALRFPPDQIKTQLGMPGVTAETVEQFIAEQERIAAGGAVTIPPELKAVADEHGWPDDLVIRAVKLGAATEFLINQIKAGITPEQAAPFIAQQEAARSGGLASTLDLSWMKVPTEWGIRVRPGKKGLTVDMLNVSTYADIPDHWPYQTEMPRGAYPLSGIPSLGYTIFDKADLWSDNAGDLYEEAIQRRWRPATEIKWDTIEPLPDEIERAMCQLCTYICEKSLLHGDTIGRWLPEMSYGYHEVKLYLSTVAYDCAQHFEVFRKRALSNGGGMGMQSPGYFHRGIIDTRSWTEASVVLHILSNSFLMGLYQMGEYIAHNDAESNIFRYCMQGTARQLAYGAQHLKYFLTRNLDRRGEVQNYLNKAEAIFAFEEEKDVPFREAVIILLGGGISDEQVSDGVRKVEYFKRRWVRDYLARLSAAGIDRRDKLHPALRQYAEEPVEAAA